MVQHLLEDLSQASVSVRDTGISGRYHTPIHEGIPQKILEICQIKFSPIFDGQSLVRSNTDAHLFSDESIALLALECILKERADWYSTISTAASALKNVRVSPFILSFGNDAVPQSVARSFPVVKSTMITDQVNGIVKLEMPVFALDRKASVIQEYPKDAIAIIGMSCRFPGADSIDEFWDLLTEGKSMLSEIPEARFGRNRPTRFNGSLRFWGNFLRDIEAFDHGFFKKSPREAVSMDPQQRILLQVAYEALEMSGYFAESTRSEDVGCYIGACATDYDFNVASHPPSAYSATGTLRSFLSGKLSHYFGWSGPSIVLDTACSSSAVAIHTACTALRAGQCSQALAGGITLMTSPYLFENFAAAHFLSPTGGSKPFSADADGYCRGEGGGLVVLKRLSDAFRDDDHIISVIAGSAVNQNDNCVPITVPHTTSQGNLFIRATRQAGVAPNKIDFVEAHGTGTPVGDPVEMESIRRIFGGPDRQSSLIVSSAKGNIGHLEGASGVAALIKAILQMEHRLAPRQALFKTLNPKIPALEPDNLCIPTSNVPLSGERLTACVNNYGAAGSNAALIILEAPPKGVTHQTKPERRISSPSKKFPIQLAAGSVGGLLAYCKTLDKFCDQFRDLDEHSQILSNLAFSLATRLNQELSFTFTVTATDLDQLHTQLRQQIAPGSAVKQRPKEPPVVLCFGGQISDKVALDKCLWQESTLLRSHLDMCDNTLRVMGYPGVYPAIFQPEAVNDVVVLHSIIFATQYSCAQAWLESGLKVNALIGHSFGQLTALCVSGILSLEDGLKLVAGRASLMQKYWGTESGTMIAIEIDQQTLEELQTALRASNAGYSFEIACFNGPMSHVVVSDKASASELETKLTERAIRYRRLNVPYGFHSRFTEPLLPYLEDLASSLTFHKPNIPLETCTDTSSWTTSTAKLVSAHTREPVFFGQAVQRLQAKLGPSTWLEAGSDSSIVSMARRALGHTSAATGNNFVPLQLNKPNCIELVVDATVALWTAGHRAQFWSFHRSQRAQYDYLRLPPYAWEKSKHWLDLDMSVALPSNDKTQIPPAVKVELPPVLIRLQALDSRGHHFVINPSSEEYQAVIKGLESLGSYTCPSTFYLELASRAVRMANKGESYGLLPIRDFQVHSRLGSNVHQTISLDLLQLAQGWRFRITSADESSDGSKLGELSCNAEGIIHLKTADNSLDDEFCRYERLTGHDKIASIADDPRSESIRGNVMYKMLARAINYPEWYRGVKSVAALDSRVVASVTRTADIPEIVSKNITTHLPILESFIQVASLHANCLHECADGEVFHFTKADYLQWAPGFELHGHQDSAEGPWDVVAYTSTTVREVAYDMFVYNAVTARLVLLILGVRFSSFCQPLTIPAGLNTSLAPTLDIQTLTNVNVEKAETGATSQQSAVPQPQAKPKKQGKSAKKCIYEDICDLLEKLADIPKDQVPGDTSFDDIGVDSLMMIEVISELSTLYRVQLPIDELEELTDFNSLVDYLHGKDCVGTSFVDDGDSPSPLSSSQTTSTGTSSPPRLSGDSATATPPGSPKLADEAYKIAAKPKPVAVPAFSNGTGMQPLDLGPFGLQDIFTRLRFDFEKYAEQTGAIGFWTNVYPQQEDLVCSYVVDAYRKLSCDLASLHPGQQLPSMNTLPRHKHLVAQLRNILLDSGYLEVGSNQVHVRTGKPFDSTSTATRYERMLQRHPLYASETKLLHAIGSFLADCLMGKAEPLSLLFGDKHNRELLADFYANSQMLKAVTCLLADFINSAFSTTESEGTLCILEVGAGTRGTTKYLVEFLTRCGVSFEYTFTDISMALVSQAKRNFSSFPQMRFRTFDCDRPAPQEFLQKFHIVISTNCIHATSNLVTSTANILPTLREDGALCLLEFTRNLYWFDLVFGLLEGWWCFSDGRQHALVNELFWNSSLREAGFKHVSFTDGNTEEAKTLRLICAFKGNAREAGNLAQPSGTITKRAGVPMEEIVWKRVGMLELSADIYFPKTPDPSGKKRPLGTINS